MQKARLWRDRTLVFPSAVGTLLSHSNVVRAFKVLLKRRGLPVSNALNLKGMDGRLAAQWTKLSDSLRQLRGCTVAAHRARGKARICDLLVRS